MGKIGLENCKFFAYHGYYDDEKKKGNSFEVNLTVEFDFSSAAKSDDLNVGLNYEQLYAIVKNIMEGDSVNLLEHLARKIIDKIKVSFKGINLVRVKIAKLAPPIQGNIQSVWIELEE